MSNPAFAAFRRNDQTFHRIASDVVEKATLLEFLKYEHHFISAQLRLLVAGIALDSSTRHVRKINVVIDGLNAREDQADH